MKLTAFVILVSLLAAGRFVCAQEEQPEAPPPVEEFGPVQQIEFSGNTVVSDQTLRQTVRVRTEEVLTAPLLADAVRDIQAAYTERGFIAYFVFYEITSVPPPRTLVFHILEVTVAEVRIEGLERTRPDLVRELIEIQPGDVYSQRAIQQAVIRLNELAVFEEIQVFLEDGPEEGQAAIVFNFAEGRTRRIDLGGTYSPEGRLIGQVSYTEANLFGRAQRLTVSVNTETIRGRLGGSVTYFNPILGAPGRTLTARLYSDVFFRFGARLAPEIDRYFERRTGIQGIVNTPVGDSRSLAYGIRYENADVQNIPAELISPISPGGQIAVGSARLTEDRRLYMRLPASGTYTWGQLEAGYSDPDLGDSGTISKLQAERRWYVPLRRLSSEDLTAADTPLPRTLAIRAGAGTSMGDLPFFEQYFVGGVFDLRGYRESRFWGKNYLRLNTELRWPLNRRLVGVAFVDVGDAWGSDFILPEVIGTAFPQHTGFSPRVGAGLGVWWLSEFGIIRLEYARGDANRFHFALGETF